MRKVSKEIAKAFLMGERRCVGNTMTDGNTVFLHGNAIAKREGGEVYVTLAGWPTVTTRERVNTILNYLGSGIGVTQRDFSTKWVNLPIGVVVNDPNSDWVKVA